MKRISYYLLGIVLTFPLYTHSALALTLQDFRDFVFRPNNLPIGETGNVTAESKVIDILNFLINLLLFASGSVAVLMLVYGGIRLVTSAGNQEQRDQAVKIIKWAVVGLVLVILAYAIVTNVINLIYRATT